MIVNTTNFLVVNMKKRDRIKIFRELRKYHDRLAVGISV